MNSMQKDTIVENHVKDVSVLVVDDSEMNVDLLENMLEHYNYTTYTTVRGSEAIKIAQTKLPEIILLDINMPGMDGYEVCRQLKADERTADIPVIFISALDDTDNIIEGFDVGGVDYITKPFKYREVIARIQTQVTLLRQKRQIEEMRQRETQHFESMDKLRRQFIGSATHDLKNPLFVISGYADMLEMSPEVKDSDHLVAFVHSIQRGVDKMSDLVHDILDLLQLETGVTLKKSKIDFTTFLEESIKDMRVRAKEKNVSLTLHKPDEIASINIDRQRFSRVIDNLVSNAIKFTSEGAITVRVSTVEESTVCIEVTDTGIGLNQEQINRLFNRFEQADSSTTRKYGGTGLGLSISKQLVELMHGHISVVSEPKQGSTFKVILPLQKMSEAQVKDKEEVHTDIPNLREYKILIAEDNQVNRMVISAMLAPTQAVLGFAENGLEATQMATRQHYDLVLMDIQMPEMDGVQACQIIQQQLPKLPIVALTANVMEQDVKTYLSSGFVAHLGKPIEIDQLMTLLKRLLEH